MKLVPHRAKVKKTKHLLRILLRTLQSVFCAAREGCDPSVWEVCWEEGCHREEQRRRYNWSVIWPCCCSRTGQRAAKGRRNNSHELSFGRASNLLLQDFPKTMANPHLLVFGQRSLLTREANLIKRFTPLYVQIIKRSSQKKQDRKARVKVSSLQSLHILLWEILLWEYLPMSQI